MSQLVQIAPGVVFSDDVLGAEWARKYRLVRRAALVRATNA